MGRTAVARPDAVIAEILTTLMAQEFGLHNVMRFQQLRVDYRQFIQLMDSNTCLNLSKSHTKATSTRRAKDSVMAHLKFRAITTEKTERPERIESSARRILVAETFIRRNASLALLAVAFALSLPRTSPAQQPWSASSEQKGVGGAINPTRTTETHSESNGQVVDKTSVETLGPDGRYVPYSETERQSTRVNDTTVRTIERSFGADSDGHRTLVQQREVETRSLTGGEQRVTRTVSNPDANGGMQVVQRELETSKDIGPGVRVTNTTLLAPDVNGGFAPVIQTEQRETRSSNGTVESKKSTFLSDGTGGWKLSEVRASTSKQESPTSITKEENVLRPDSNGNLTVVERTVSQQAQAADGSERATAEKYSTNFPGVAGDNGLQLVERETVRRDTSSRAQTTSRQIEQPRPGNRGESLHVTQQAIDIVRPGASGTSDTSSTILVPDSSGRLTEVWVDTGTTSNPSAVQVDTKTSAKPQ